MSSLTRRLQICGLKRLGYRRADYRIAKNAAGGEVRITVARGGLILNADGEGVGYRWPRAAVA